MDTRLTVAAHWAISSLPTAVEPVKENLATLELSVNTRPMPRASLPVTMLKTPGGKPAISASRASARADSGVSEAGRRTKVQPTARAGAALRVIMELGKFQGVIAATTPTGCLITTMRRSAVGAGMVSPYTRLPSSANHSTNEAP